jgi:hypothetical protein
MSPRKDKDAADFLAKLAARRVSSPDGVFINNLHEPSTHILEGSIQTHFDANLALRVFDLGASMMTSPVDIAMVALDQAD